MPGRPAWRMSSLSFSNGNCVEAAGKWRKSSASGSNGQCAEVTTTVPVAHVLVRDSKQGDDGPVLRFSSAAWKSFLNTFGE